MNRSRRNAFPLSERLRRLQELNRELHQEQEELENGEFEQRLRLLMLPEMERRIQKEQIRNMLLESFRSFYEATKAMILSTLAEAPSLVRQVELQRLEESWNRLQILCTQVWFENE
jgi:hypothetical protein